MLSMLSADFTKDTHDFDDWSANLKVMFDNCNETVSDDCNVYLYAHGIFKLSPETLDLEMLLDPFEKVMRSFT